MRLNILVYSVLFAYKLAFSLSYELPSYDLEPITPKTWQQVVLKYSDIINGKKYPAEIKLLRPINWLKYNGIDQVGNKAVFSLPEFGVESAEVEVISVLPTTVDTSRVNWSVEKSRPVIGKFKRYAEDVRTYMFQDMQGNVEEINATPNHPFYAKNKGEFIAIDDVTTSDELIDQLGKSVKLVCPVDKNRSCGQKYNDTLSPVEVYNLEVYRKHVYYVGKNSSILTHNGCFGSSDKAADFLDGFEFSMDSEFLYRIDGRKPTTILKDGFNGSNNRVPNKVYGNKTVFTSTDPVRGSKEYLAFAMSNDSQFSIRGRVRSGGSMYLYGILSEGLERTPSPRYGYERYVRGPIDAQRIVYLGKYNSSKAWDFTFTPSGFLKEHEAIFNVWNGGSLTTTQW
ncbi:polymorphic toxin-type HINT domain-containing protein [Cysteiniphilum litorale]|uniref:polymorphic toxin-type HINT domain-containing protein n=1 Tax=Cysteiniphilum litorale TaxID=2056700 RepID=UPI003F88384D